MTSEENKNIIFKLVMIALIAILLGLGLVYFIENQKIQNPAPPSLSDIVEKKNIQLAGQNLYIPTAWLSKDSYKNSDNVEKINLLFNFALSDSQAKNLVEAVLKPASRTPTSAKLLDSVYLHQFTNEQKKGVSGLIGKPLKEIAGFKGETIWYDPLSASPFVAKCMKPILQEQKQKCIRTVAMNRKITITYIFDFEMLQNWKNFDLQAQKWLSKIDGL